MSYVIPDIVVLRFRSERLLMLHTYLWMTFALLIQQLYHPPSLLSLSSLLHHSLFSPALTLLPFVALLLSPPAQPLILPLCSRLPRSTQSSGLQRDRNSRCTAECSRCSSCMCVFVWAVWACLNAFLWNCAALCASEASDLEDVCLLQADGMQMFLTSVAGKAA